jgi:hypothetical protein
VVLAASITALDQSSCLADRNFFNSTCNPLDAVCRTYKIPHNACRSGTRDRPSTSFGPGLGGNGSISDHSSSDTTHGRD